MFWSLNCNKDEQTPPEIIFCGYYASEAVVQRCSVKKVLLENSRNSPKNTCARAFFLIKACNFIKKETLAPVFSCEFCEILKNTFFIEHLRWLLLFRLNVSIIPDCYHSVSIFTSNRLSFSIRPDVFLHNGKGLDWAHNHDDLANLSFILKVWIFSETYLEQIRTTMMKLFPKIVESR